MKIFILEDDEARILAFEQALKVFAGGPHEVTIAKWLDGEGGAYEKFRPPYDLILLDHDLGGMVYLESDGEEETGYKFVKWLVRNFTDKPDTFDKTQTDIIIHSYNRGGANLMGFTLHDAGFHRVMLEPFGRNLLKHLEALLPPITSEVSRAS